MRYLERLTGVLETLLDESKESPRSTAALVMQELEKRAVEAGTLTRDGRREMLEQLLQEAGVTKMVSRIEELQSGGPVTSDPSESERPHYHLWSGKFHRLPSTYTHPSGTALMAWQCWCCPDTHKGYPPLHSVSPDDIFDQKVRHKLCDLKFLMSKIEKKAKEEGVWVESPSLEEANEMFSRCSGCIALPGKHRMGQMKWTTHAKILRKKLREDALNLRIA
jgi:hypothetical protein